MRFPEKYTKRGKFKLHSGQISDIFYDVNEMLTNHGYVRQILSKIPLSKHYVGIATGGAIIASLIASTRGESKFSMVKDGELKGKVPNEDYILIDDVVTTGNSLKESLRIIGKPPKNIFVVLDRRKTNKNPEVIPVFEI